MSAARPPRERRTREREARESSNGPRARRDHASVRVGLVSDTHGWMRPEALAALAGSDAILHAGDIGEPGVLAALRGLAPVTAVRGNNDRAPWAQALPLVANVTIAHVRFLVIHDLATLAVDPAAAGIRVVVSGHSHRAKCETRDGVLFVNPGSAGPRRFRLPLSVARVHVIGGEVDARIVELDIAASSTSARVGPPAPAERRP